MILPLAIYSAKHGLEWRYPHDGIAILELDECRSLFGPLPDFDFGDVGFEGMAAKGDKVILARCFKAEKWDFLGRDSLYFAVTWISREDAGKIDVEKVFASPYFSVPMRDAPPYFEVEECDGAEKVPIKSLDEGTVLRRQIGSVEFERFLCNTEIPQVVDTLQEEDKEVASATLKKTVDWWRILQWIAISVSIGAVLIMFVRDLSKRYWRQQDDGSGEIVEERGVQGNAPSEK
jgi:hypothetical protein